MMTLLIVLYQHKQVTVGDFALILTLTMSLFQQLWHIANQIGEVYKQLGKCTQAMPLLSTPNEIVNADGASPLQCDHGGINFADVTFAYESGNDVYQELCLQIPAGQKVGLVGFSGCGKSTLINLLTRQFDLHSGKISIDAQDISKVTLDSLREHISLIPQDPVLFHRSLRDNIRYGNLEATEEMVLHAAQQAHCHEFIASLPDGYDTLVGERGVKLSGGQRQRIAIARALLDSAPILVLDEATSSLDSVTEQKIQASLQCAFKNRTTIVVAHRLSTLLQMDRIIVIDKGQIIEDGCHADLLEANGQFAKMWSLQKDGFLPDTV